MPEPTYEELKARLAALESQTKNRKNTPGVEFRITEEDGLFQLRRVAPQSVNLPEHVVRYIISNAQTIIPFMSAHKHLLSDPTDSTEVCLQKAVARQEDLKSENPVVRPKKDISWRSATTE